MSAQEGFGPHTDARFLQTVVAAGSTTRSFHLGSASDGLLREMISRHRMVPTLTVFDAYDSLTGAQANVPAFRRPGRRIALGSDYTDIPRITSRISSSHAMHEIDAWPEQACRPCSIVARPNAARTAVREELGARSR